MSEPNFWVVEGIDGSGKSHLLTQLAALLQHTTATDLLVLRKDSPPPAERWADQRLVAMHRLTWGYDHDEPVWHYPAPYWLHSIAAWYALFHRVHIAPALESGLTAIVDGWHFKHHARMMLSGDVELQALAALVFASLPQPDHVVRLMTPATVAAHQRCGTSKPSEHGAFATGTADTSEQSFTAYQARTATALDTLLHQHSATVHPIAGDTSPAGLLALLGNRGRP